MAKVTRLLSPAKGIVKVPPPRNYQGERLGHLALNPELYPWAELGAFAIFMFGGFLNGHLHAVDLGEGELLAYVYQAGKTNYRLKFICAGFEGREYPKTTVMIKGNVTDLYISEDPLVRWHADTGQALESFLTNQERPLLKARL